jgi:putative glutamine amidotransferase
MRPRIAVTLEMNLKGNRRINYLDLAYAEAVEMAGGQALHFPSLPSSETISEILSIVDGLVLTGGADIHPSFYGQEIQASVRIGPAERTEFDLALFHGARRAGKPILAICHGMQIMNVALGGTLYQDLPTQYAGALAHRDPSACRPIFHRVKVAPGTHLAKILGGEMEIEVPSIHHQAVKDLAPGLRVSARSPDGLIEGIELFDHPQVIAVQWHPEEDPQSWVTRRLFRALVERASRS